MINLLLINAYLSYMKMLAKCFIKTVTTIKLLKRYRRLIRRHACDRVHRAGALTDPLVDTPADRSASILVVESTRIKLTNKQLINKTTYNKSLLISRIHHA